MKNLRWVAAVVAVAVVVGCRAKKPLVQDDPIANAPRLVAAAIVLANAPTARTVACAGMRSGAFAELFASCGLSVTSNLVDTVAPTSGRDSGIDLLFVAPSPGRARPVTRETLAAAAVVVERIDVRGMAAPALEARLKPYAGKPATLWMPGAHDWFVVARASTNGVSFAEMSEAFGRDGVSEIFGSVGCDAVTEIFASYVGTVDEVLPAFGSDLRGEVLPQWFVTREVPEVRGIVWTDVDERIRKRALGEIRSRQNVRRQVLQANEQSLKGNEDAAVEGWAKALRLNPCEPLLLERLGLLGVNARTFRSLGKVSLAAKCYETMMRICPGDPLPVKELAACLESLGHRELAEKARERARALGRAHVAEEP